MAELEHSTAFRKAAKDACRSRPAVKMNVRKEQRLCVELHAMRNTDVRYKSAWACGLDRLFHRLLRTYTLQYGIRTDALSQRYANEMKQVQIADGWAIEMSDSEATLKMSAKGDPIIVPRTRGMRRLKRRERRVVEICRGWSEIINCRTDRIHASGNPKN
jgi:hypothetical protein